MKTRLLAYVSGGIATLALAGTLFVSTGCTTFYSHKPETLEQKVIKKEQVLEQSIIKKGKIGNVAVLLIDMQEFFLESITSEEKVREIPYQLEVLDYCKEKNIPVLVIESSGFRSTIHVLKEKVDSLEKKVYITKHCDDGFVGTDLAKQLKGYSIDTLLLMGINATACVAATSYGALKEGFNIMTSKDLIADPPYFKSDEGVRWYSTYGVHRDNYKDILDIISKGEVEFMSQQDDISYIPSFVFPEEPLKKYWKNPEGK